MQVEHLNSSNFVLKHSVWRVSDIPQIFSTTTSTIITAIITTTTLPFGAFNFSTGIYVAKILNK